MTREIKVDMYAGALVFWRATMTPASALRAVCTDLGVNIPWQEVRDCKALKLALMDRFARTGKMIRPSVSVTLEDGTVCAAMVVVSEQEGKAKNDYASEQKLFLHPETYEVWCFDEAGAHTLAVDVNARRYRGQVTGTKIGLGLESAIREFGGYKLRDNARIYYMPQSRMARWEAFTGALERATGVTFFRANCPADADTAKAVADNAVEELRERYREVLAKIADCDLTLGSGETGKARDKANEKRSELLAELDSIKAEAAAIDSGFRGYLNIASQITAEIDSEIAMAVLVTSI